MWTLKDEYRDLLDRKLSAATEAEAIEAVVAGYYEIDKDTVQIDRPSIYGDTESALYEFEMSLWRNAYVVNEPGPKRCFLYKQELRDMLKAAIVRTMTPV